MNALSTLHPVADSKAVACKVCAGPSPLFGVIDFHKSCIEAQGKRLPVSGYPVYYRRCASCSFTFTTAFDAWSFDDFREHIYNQDYVVVDPDYISTRPTVNARVLVETFRASCGGMEVLDYGGGGGLLAEKLREEGFSAETYDPFSSFDAMPEKRYDLITCFEVMEHVPSPQETVATMVSLMKRPGAILFSTLVQPAEFEGMGLNWWYAGPRNGHVSLYSKPSLAKLFAAHGMRVGSFSDGLHIAYAEVPGFAAHLGLPA